MKSIYIFIVFFFAYFNLIGQTDILRVDAYEMHQNNNDIFVLDLWLKSSSAKPIFYLPISYNLANKKQFIGFNYREVNDTLFYSRKFDTLNIKYITTHGGNGNVRSFSFSGDNLKQYKLKNKKHFQIIIGKRFDYPKAVVIDYYIKKNEQILKKEIVLDIRNPKLFVK